MLRIVNLEELERALLEITGLVDLHDASDPRLVEEAKDWLARLERVLQGNKMPEAGQIGALRGLLISAERGCIPEGFRFTGRITRQRLRRSTAAEVVRRGGDILVDAIRADRDRVREAEGVSRQIVTVAQTRGLMAGKGPGADRTGYLNGLWNALKGDPEIAGGLSSLEALVGRYDGMVLLDRASPE